MNEVRAVLDFFFFRLICFFSSYSFPPREITVLWDDERTYYLCIHTRHFIRGITEKKKKKAESYFLSLRTRTANDSEPEANSSCESTPQFFLFHSFSLTLFLFVSLFLSPSLFLLNSKNKRGNFATICKANGKIIFFFFSPFFSLSPFSSLKRSIL